MTPTINIANFLNIKNTYIDSCFMHTFTENGPNYDGNGSDTDDGCCGSGVGVCLVIMMVGWCAG